MCGKRICLYYRDIPKICTQCFGTHPRKGCTAEKVLWVKYVSDFMLRYDYIPAESYGKWAKIVAQWRDSSENTTQSPKENAQSIPVAEGDQQDSEQPQHPQRADQPEAPLLTEPEKTKPPRKEVDQALGKLRALGINASPVTRSKSPTYQSGIRINDQSGSGNLHNTNNRNLNANTMSNPKEMVTSSKQKK